VSNDDSYSRTPAATLCAISSAVNTDQKPKEIYNNLLNKGDIRGEPRNPQQIRNKKYYEARIRREKREHGASDVYRANIADEILQVLNLTQSNAFVRSVTITKAKVPAVILYNDSQIVMLKSFCFLSTSGSVLSVDKTYNLGSMFVTSTVFTYKALFRRSTGDEPIFIGPIFFHGQSDFDTFSVFFSHVAVLMADSDTNQLLLGSD